MAEEKYALGMDFGTESARALVVNVNTGEEAGTASAFYKRFADAMYCDPAKTQYRQHPLDHIESMEAAVKGAVQGAAEKTKDGNIGAKIVGIGICTTGSTPGPVDRNGTPLALLDELGDDPDAMFVLWKDHTALEEAELINAASRRTEGGKYTQYCGGTYSAEWFWSKILHSVRTSGRKPVDTAFSWVELCDWIPAFLSGETNPLTIKRSRCAAGHKALWHASWGLPFDFLQSVDPRLGEFRERLFTETFTSDREAGKLSPEWAERFGLNAGTPIAVGGVDAHFGAVGGGIRPGLLCRIIGTSTCDMVVAEYSRMMEDGREKVVNGICGQVDGSIIPGMFGMEAGQSAVGDIFANFRDWFVDTIFALELTPPFDREELKNRIYDVLTEKAGHLRPDEVPLVIDYHNGRRTPNADQRLTGMAAGLTLGTDAPAYFAGLVQGTCYTARQIMQTFTDQGIPVDGVLACGGIADKSPYLMQTMSDVMGVEIQVAASSQTPSAGAAMFASVVGGAHGSVIEARKKMYAGSKRIYTPRDEFAGLHNARYREFIAAVGRNESMLRTLRK
ncbi:MAG: ribulokinase [Planctomycetota bacterium]